MNQSINREGKLSPLSPEVASVLTDVQDRWNRAASNWDVDGLAALYTDDALMYGGRPGMSVGKPGVRDYFASYRDMLASTRLSLVEQLVAELATDVYLLQGYGIFEFKLVNGKMSGTTMRTTLVLDRRGGVWRIAQHHFSSTPEAPPVPQ